MIQPTTTYNAQLNEVKDLEEQYSKLMKKSYVTALTNREEGERYHQEATALKTKIDQLRAGLQ